MCDHAHGLDVLGREDLDYYLNVIVIINIGVLEKCMKNYMIT